MEKMFLLKEWFKRLLKSPVSCKLLKLWWSNLKRKTEHSWNKLLKQECEITPSLQFSKMLTTELHGVVWKLSGPYNTYYWNQIVQLVKWSFAIFVIVVVCSQEAQGPKPARFGNAWPNKGHLDFESQGMLNCLLRACHECVVLINIWSHPGNNFAAQ